MTPEQHRIAQLEAALGDWMLTAGAWALIAVVEALIIVGLVIWKVFT